MKIIGHHTCSSNGIIQEIEQKGAFLSTHLEENLNQHKFLGSGYYFWDNNLNMAHYYGQENYKRKYYIFEAELNLIDDYFLDLAGNRIDMIYFQEIMSKLQEIDESTKDWTLVQFIEFLKSKNEFPYRAIRAVNTVTNPKKVMKFVQGRDDFINLNPIFIVCLLDKKNDIVTSFKHIKTFPQNG